MSGDYRISPDRASFVGVRSYGAEQRRVLLHMLTGICVQVTVSHLLLLTKQSYFMHCPTVACER